MLQRLGRQLPYLRGLHGKIEELRNELKRWRTWMPPGHFYSPIPALSEIERDASRIFPEVAPELLGVDLNTDGQLAHLRSWSNFIAELPRDWLSGSGGRYRYENEYYGYADGISLYCLLRALQPKRYVEIGSGFSSALVLDTNERFLNSQLQCSFVEPYPDRLKTLLQAGDSAHTRLFEQPVQHVPMEVFTDLEAGDILLIDSSHVAKTGSDFNHLIFEVVPRLRSGVFIHVHDVFFPFEYPRVWVETGIAWNEAYVLRAFLQYNTEFRIEFFTSYVLREHRALVEEVAPLMLKGERVPLKITDSPGSSLWLRRQ